MRMSDTFENVSAKYTEVAAWVCVLITVLLPGRRVLRLKS